MIYFFIFTWVIVVWGLTSVSPWLKNNIDPRDKFQIKFFKIAKNKTENIIYNIIIYIVTHVAIPTLIIYVGYSHYENKEYVSNLPVTTIRCTATIKQPETCLYENKQLTFNEYIEKLGFNTILKIQNHSVNYPIKPYYTMKVTFNPRKH